MSVRSFLDSISGTSNSNTNRQFQDEYAFSDPNDFGGKKKPDQKKKVTNTKKSKDKPADKEKKPKRAPKKA
jgi:hypothetical protein